jgi:hypothetical protein
MITKLKKQIKKIVPTSILSYFAIGLAEMDKYAFDKNLEVKKDIQDKYGFNGKLLDIFVTNNGPVVHKFHHYIPIYDRYFSKFCGRNVRFLEIGVSKGGSLQMWRKYFGDEAIIYGIDIDPNCRSFNGQGGQVRIGSQDDLEFLNLVIQEMGGVDIVLDDGSHQMKHISATLKALFPILNYGGVYLVEDLHTAYWRGFGGGYRATGNFFKVVTEVIHDMHHWYHANDIRQVAISKSCSSIHIHDSITVFEKNKVYQPVHSQIG